jgi:hypothetical protein
MANPPASDRPAFWADKINTFGASWLASPGATAMVVVIQYETGLTSHIAAPADGSRTGPLLIGI